MPPAAVVSNGQANSGGCMGIEETTIIFIAHPLFPLWLQMTDRRRPPDPN